MAEEKKKPTVFKISWTWTEMGRQMEIVNVSQMNIFKMSSFGQHPIKITYK